MKDEGWRTRLIERPRWHVAVEQRYCHVHPASRAVDRCDRCGEPFCAACLQQVERWRVCAACVAQFRREERAGRLPARLHRMRREIVAGISILVVLTLVVVGLQALLQSGGSNADLLRSAEIVGSKLHGGAAQQPAATLQVVGTLSADHPPATLLVVGHGFQPGAAVTLRAEVDGPGALLGQTERGQAGVTTLGAVIARADGTGAISAQIAVPDAATVPAPYRIQVHAQEDHKTAGTLDVQPGGS